MTSAAGGLGVPVERLKLAKRAGCPAFMASGRVDVSKLIQWLLTNRKAAPPSGGWDWNAERCALAREKRAGLELSRKEREGQLIDCGVSIQICERWAQPIREAWLAMPGNLAALVNPTDPQHAQRIMQQRLDSLMRLLEVPTPKAAK